MNDADVSKQTQQMVRFIHQEAEEKANEISVSAEEEFNIEKLQLVEAEKKKIRQEYERKEKQVQVRKKIEYSMQLNASRIKVLQAQDDLVNSMKESASKELLHVSSHQNSYKQLLKDLIVQSLLRLKEPSVLLRCRKDDVRRSMQRRLKFIHPRLLLIMSTFHLLHLIIMHMSLTALEVLYWLLEMAKLCLRILSMLDWMLYFVKSCRRFERASSDILPREWWNTFSNFMTAWFKIDNLL